LRPAVKDQFIEVGGSFEDGNLYYLYSGIARSCYYGPDVDKPIISRIWKKHEVIFDVNCFLKSKNRNEAIQMLEDGELLSISYPSLKSLIETFPKTLSLLLFLQAENETYYKFYQHLLKQTVEERVRLYLNNNPTISSRINKDCIALHLGISRSKFSSAYTLYKQYKETKQVNWQ
jgi:CRP-like cAMP-binding protein